jgi:hypothetical protein
MDPPWGTCSSEREAGVAYRGRGFGPVAVTIR